MTSNIVLILAKNPTVFHNGFVLLLYLPDQVVRSQIDGQAGVKQSKQIARFALFKSFRTNLSSVERDCGKIFEQRPE